MGGRKKEKSKKDKEESERKGGRPRPAGCRHLSFIFRKAFPRRLTFLREIHLRCLGARDVVEKLNQKLWSLLLDQEWQSSSRGS